MLDGRLDSPWRPAGLPLAAELAQLLGTGGAGVGGALERALVGPARDLVERPSKQFRSRLLHLAFLIAARGQVPDGRKAAQLAQAAQAIELLHAGSLIVDDIQDQSRSRRGAPSLHERYGLSQALCTGNWLYFWPLRLLSELGLAPDVQAQVFRHYHDAVERAHYGQALDLSIKVNALTQDEMKPVCRVVLELKTGAIAALAMGLGALMAGASPDDSAAMQAFGQSFGCALQQLDDLGNLQGGVEPDKRFEDMLQRKPTAVWGFAAEQMSPARFARFRTAALALPDGAAEFIAQLRDDGFFAAAAASTRRELDGAFAELQDHFAVLSDDAALLELRAVAERLLHAYG